MNWTLFGKLVMSFITVWTFYELVLRIQLDFLVLRNTMIYSKKQVVDFYGLERFLLFWMYLAINNFHDNDQNRPVQYRPVAFIPEWIMDYNIQARSLLLKSTYPSTIKSLRSLNQKQTYYLPLILLYTTNRCIWNYHQRSCTVVIPGALRNLIIEITCYLLKFNHDLTMPKILKVLIGILTLVFADFAHSVIHSMNS